MTDINILDPHQITNGTKKLKAKLQAAGVDLFKHRDLYEWLLDAMVSEYKQGMADASKIYKEVYKLEK